jgi:YXWGXW repeat-containing protein
MRAALGDAHGPHKRKRTMMKKLLLGTMVAASLGVGSVSVATADVFVRVAPPAPRTEVVPPARRGYVWTPGYWDWRGNRHVWVNGHYVRERRGYHYATPSWHEQNGRWVLQRGGWARGDRDHDGVPNRADRDRDGDGVPNRVDSNPNNPRRN